MFHKYLVLLRVNWAGVLAYRAAIIIYMLHATMPLVSLAVWLSLSADGPIGNYSSTDFVAYYLALIFVRHMTGAWVSYHLDHDIREGTLSAKLLKPINPVHDHIAVHLADKLFRLPLILIPIAVVARLVPGVHFDLSLPTIAYTVIAMALAFGIIFLSSYCIGLLNFWLTHAMALEDLWFGIRMLLAGTLAPIDLLPAPIPQISPYLPFRYTLSFPVEIILGRLNSEQLMLGFAVQLIWLLAFVGLYWVLWIRGLKEYTAVGA